MSKNIKLYQIDAFTNEVYKGNPAGVCVLENDVTIDDKTMQSIAMEMNISETAFVKPVENNDIKNSTEFNLKWFTPTTEIKLCGHATLATSHVLFNHYKCDTNTIEYNTLSGKLFASKTKYNDSNKNGIQLDFPIGKPEKQEKTDKVLIESLGLKDYNYDVFYCNKTHFYLVDIHDELLLRKLKQDFNKMLSINSPSEKFCVIITSESKNTEYDFISRCFAPSEGVNEDPVTGAAHTVLAPYWANVLNKKEFNAYQSSKRGGELHIKIIKDRVHLIGEAITFFETTISI